MVPKALGEEFLGGVCGGAIHGNEWGKVGEKWWWTRGRTVHLPGSWIVSGFGKGRWGVAHHGEWRWGERLEMYERSGIHGRGA